MFELRLIVNQYNTKPHKLQCRQILIPCMGALDEITFKPNSNSKWVDIPLVVIPEGQSEEN